MPDPSLDQAIVVPVADAHAQKSHRQVPRTGSRWQSRSSAAGHNSSVMADELFADELHPNTEGVRIIAEEVYKALLVLHGP